LNIKNIILKPAFSKAKAFRIWKAFAFEAGKRSAIIF